MLEIFNKKEELATLKEMLIHHLDLQGLMIFNKILDTEREIEDMVSFERLPEEDKAEIGRQLENDKN